MLKFSPRPDWHERPLVKLLLRLAGILLLGLAWWSGSTLLRRYGGKLEHPPLEYLLALAAILCASAGSALTVTGHHLFDKAEIAARWGRSSAATELWHRDEDNGPEE
jgi:hypothetical protein